jgi:hypothetical protein
VPTSIQILSQAGPVKEVGAKPIEEVISRSITEGQSNLGF